MRHRWLLVIVTLSACTSVPSRTPASTTVRASASDGASSIASPVGPPPPVGRPIDVASLRGRIAFSDETQDIWVAQADGSGAHRITHTSAQEFDPTWSPDGSRIAYRHQPGDDETTEIFVMDADGAARWNLTRNHVADWGPDWSPSGRWIAWNSAVGTGGGALLGYVMRPDGSGVRRISRHDVEYPAWSPDGSKIAFMAQESGAAANNPDYNIFVMDADGSNIRRLTESPGEDGWPAWSPDGSRIVFASARDDCAVSQAPDCLGTGDLGPWLDVWIMSADGSHLRRVTTEFGQFFAWSPDGREIMVAGGASLYVVRPDGSGRSEVPVSTVPHPLFPDWIV
jgi:Tol biopolymer transport system component